MDIPASAARRRPVLRPALLLALTLALLLGGWIALSPATVDAQNMSFYGRWYAKVGSTAICPAQRDIEADAGTYSRTSANAITLNFKRWEIVNCGPANVDQLSWGTRGSDYTAGADYAGNWYLELRTLPGSGGSLIHGAHISLPDAFSGRRTSGLLNRRDQSSDGHWPNGDIWHGDLVPVVHPASISFTIPASHAGPVYLHAGIFFNEQGDNNDVWEDFSFKFDSPEPPAAASAPRACAGPLERTVNVLGFEYDSRDSHNRPTRYSMVQVTALYDCNGELYTSRTQYGAPVGNIPANIARPRTPHCSEIQTGVSWDYDRDAAGNILATQSDRGARYAFRVHWTGDGCDRPVQYPGSVGGGTYCGGGVLSQTPSILQRAITGDDRIVYQVRLVQQLRGPGINCPFEISNLLWTYNLPETITAP